MKTENQFSPKPIWIHDSWIGPDKLERPFRQLACMNAKAEARKEGRVAQNNPAGASGLTRRVSANSLATRYFEEVGVVQLAFNKRRSYSPPPVFDEIQIVYRPD